MKLTRILLAFILATSSLCGFAQSHKGENAVGVRGGYNIRNHTGVAGLYYQKQFSNSFRLSPNIDFIFRHHDSDAIGINLNAHFPMAITSTGRWNFYPLLGVSLTAWSYHNQTTAEDNDVTTRKTRFGLNFGAGTEYYCTPTLKLTLEAKYNLVKAYSSGLFSLGIAYVF